MKIYSQPETIRFVPGGDGDSTAESFQREQRKKRQEKAYSAQPKSLLPEIVEVTEEKLEQAVLGFQADSQARQQGIGAEKAPGLRVVLKDSDGNVIRQVSGEEFIRMRMAIEDGRLSGKIFDQKA